jgi:hypothetical protein
MISSFEEWTRTRTRTRTRRVLYNLLAVIPHSFIHACINICAMSGSLWNCGAGHVWGYGCMRDDNGRERRLCRILVLSLWHEIVGNLGSCADLTSTLLCRHVTSDVVASFPNQIKRDGRYNIIHPYESRGDNSNKIIKEKKPRGGEYHRVNAYCVLHHQRLFGSRRSSLGERSLRFLNAEIKTLNIELLSVCSSIDLPAGAVIVIHGGHTTPIDNSKTAATSAPAIVQAIDSLGIIVPVLVLVLIPRAGRYIGR